MSEKILYGFISTGDKIAMYTLRLMYEVPVYQKDCEGRGYLAGYTHKDYYVKNLSNDKAKAEAAAEDICKGYGVPFKGNAEFELNEIRRRRSEEVAAYREAAERATREFERRQAEEFERVIREGVILVGKYKGMTAAEIATVDLDYVIWMSTGDLLEGARDPMTVSTRIAKAYLEANPPVIAGHIGVVGEALTAKVVVKSIRGFNGFYGTSWAFSCVAEGGERISFFTTSKKLLELEEGEEFVLEGVVSEHGQYNGFPQTVVKKPKIAKPKKK